MTEAHAQMILSSYQHWVKKSLIDIDPTKSLLEQLNEANVVILSHGTEPDPILNYGNKLALELWEMTLDQFIMTPSRLTAEPLEREQRAEFMKQVTEQGYVANYTGIRVSRTGRRFYIQQATVWNLYDEAGQYCGQAASFSNYERIPS